MLKLTWHAVPILWIWTFINRSYLYILRLPYLICVTGFLFLKIILIEFIKTRETNIYWLKFQQQLYSI